MDAFVNVSSNSGILVLIRSSSPVKTSATHFSSVQWISFQIGNCCHKIPSACHCAPLILYKDYNII